MVGPARESGIVSAWLTDLSFNWDAATQGVRVLQFAKGQTIFLEGQPADTVYVIEEGRVRLASYSVDGKERHLMIMGPNGLIGDCALRASPRYVVFAVAATATSVRAVPVAVMVQAIEANRALFHQWQQLTGMRFRILQQHLALLGSNSARRRVCHHLLGLMHSYASPHADGTRVAIAFTQEEMGRICGLSRVSVSQIFSMLEREGVITHAGRCVVVRDHDRLVTLSTH